MPSPICLVNSTATTNGVDVANSAAVTIQLADTAGVKQWSLTCINTDDSQSKSFINSILSVNQVTKTATFTAPDAGDDGAAFIFESKINNGTDVNGRADSTLTTRFGIYILTLAGVRVAALDETTEGNAEFGWVVKFNDVIRNFGGGGTVGTASAGNGLVFSGGMYNVVAADGSITVNADSIQVGTISAAQHGNQTSGTLHTAATTSVAGFMSASDKTKLDNAVSTATASRLAIRDGSGNCSFSTVTATTGAITTLNSTTANVTGTSTLGTLSVTGTGTIATLSSPSGTITTLGSTTINATTVNGTNSTFTGSVNSGSFLFSSSVSETRVLAFTPVPDSSWTFDADSWIAGGGAPDIYARVQLPHGVTLNSLSVRIDPIGGHAGLPSQMPRLTLKVLSAADFNTAILNNTAIDTSANVTAYQANHLITLSSINHVVDASAYQYIIIFEPESGTNAMAGMEVMSFTATWTKPIGFSIGRN